MAVQVETKHWLDIPGGRGVLFSCDRTRIKDETNVVARIQPIEKRGPAKLLLKGIGVEADQMDRAKTMALDAIAANKNAPRPPGVPTGDAAAHQWRMTANPNSNRQLKLRSASATQVPQMQMPMMIVVPVPGMMNGMGMGGMCGMAGMMGGMGMPVGMNMGAPPPPPPPGSQKAETASSEDASDASSSSSAPEEAFRSKANETKEQTKEAL